MLRSSIFEILISLKIDAADAIAEHKNGFYGFIALFVVTDV